MSTALFNLHDVREIIDAVKTPLGLAALALAVMAISFAAIISARRQNKVVQDISKYCFIIGLVFGVLSISSYVYEKINPDYVKISGLVVDQKTGGAVDFANVSIVGGPQRDADGGKFEFLLPRAEFANGVDIHVSDTAYVSQSVRLNEGDAKALVIRLEPKLNEKSIIDRIDFINVGHWIGLPFIFIDLKFYNKNDQSIKISSISISVKSANSNNNIKDLGYPKQVAIQPPQAGPEIRLRMNAQIALQASFFQPSDEFLLFATQVNDWVLRHPVPLDAQRETDRISPSLTAALQASARKNFFWMEGDYVLALKFTCDDKDRAYQIKFSLTKEQIGRMKGNVPFYRYGFGVLDTMIFAAPAPDSGIVRVDNVVFEEAQ
ncbi:carboxypeptidase-like regulatory domain-containing protein [Ancylobacter sp. FA202]|uniref:carboxypeptidase-like regulatory domain-containing protein n=1 Tax=Ancylobacter sp. FA202 TaxID=1111106 RepID=UPI001FD8AB1E|nr:carboxypeptidase-like regulatory domain-containing protein [Ancylobacter sp. FA202]